MQVSIDLAVLIPCLLLTPLTEILRDPLYKIEKSNKKNNSNNKTKKNTGPDV
jgi:hypothetical protein